MKQLIVIFICILILTSCAGSKTVKNNGGKPQWLTNPESQYPSQTYITAIGQGFSRSDAEQDAAAKLARIFRSDVQTSELTELRYEELTRGSETTTEDYGKVTKNIQLSAEESLVNIQFGESYADNMGKVYAVAYLHRYQTAAIYEEMIALNGNQINYYYKQSSKNTDPLDRYAYAGAAYTVAVKNEDLLRQIKIISPSMSRLINTPYDMNIVQENYYSCARDITFQVATQNDEDKKIASIIKKLLTQKGFRVNENAYLVVNGEITMEKTELKRDDDSVFYRWELTLDLINPQKENILTLNSKGRAGGISDTEAISRVYRDLEKYLNKKLIRELDNWFDDIVIKEK